MGPQQINNSRIPGRAGSMASVAKRAHGSENVGIVGIVGIAKVLLPSRVGLLELLEFAMFLSCGPDFNNSRITGWAGSI